MHDNLQSKQTITNRKHTHAHAHYTLTINVRTFTKTTRQRINKRDSFSLTCISIFFTMSNISVITVNLVSL